MHLLEQSQLERVSGGNFKIEMTGTVPDTLNDWVISIITKIQSGQIRNIYDFRDQLKIANNQNINFMSIKIDSIEYNQIDKI